MGLITQVLDPNNLRPLFDAFSSASDLVKGVREDSRFLGLARRTLLPLPFDREPTLPSEPFPPLEPFEAPAFRGKRVAVVGSGGSGATASLVGLQRAFEEAGIQPIALSAASGGVLFALLWACGLDAAAIARFWLGLRRRDYVDPDLRALLRSGRRAFGGWAGLLRGEALERSVRRLVGDRRLGELPIPFSMVGWNVDLNRVDPLGTRETPGLEVAVAARLAIAIPIFVEPVRFGDHLYADGGIVDIFPVRPVLQENPDLVVGVNCYLPRDFAGEDLTGWRRQSFAILRVSGQLRWSGMAELAREQARLAGDRLVLLHPVPYEEVRGARFYETFLDRSRWPAFMRAGLEAGRGALRGAAPG